MKFVISFIISVVVVAWFSQSASYIPVNSWEEGFLYAGKSIIFFGAFSDAFSLQPSIWLWGITIFIFFGWHASIQGRKEKQYQRSTQFICAKCDQYLGTGEGYTIPCPRCGSNRYYTE